MNTNESKTGEKVDKLNKKIDELETISAQKPTFAIPNQQNATTAWQKILMIIFWIASLTYIFVKFGFIGIDILGNLFVNLFSFITVPLVWGIIPGDAYIVILAGYIILMFYIDLFILIPLIYIFSIKVDPIKRIHSLTNLQIIGLVLIAIPLLTTSMYLGIFGSNDSEREHTMENFEVNTKSKWQQLVEGPLCPLINLNNPQICLEQEKEVEAEKTSRIEYEVYFNKPEFNYVEDVNRWKTQPFYLYYEIQAKGEPIYLDRIELWQNKIDDEGQNLLSNISLENQKILSNDRTPIKAIECDVSNIKTEKALDKNFKLIALLYYELESSYTQPIPVYNMDLYIENKFGSKDGVNILLEESKIRESLGKIKPVIPNNAIKLSTYTAPALPIMLGDDYTDKDKYTITFTFEKNIYTDKLISSEIIDYKIPSLFEANCIGECDATIKGPLSTYNDKSQITLDLTITDPQTIRESYEENIEFRIKSKFKKTSYIPLVINDPQFDENAPKTTPTTQTEEETETQELNNDNPIEETSQEDPNEPLQDDDGWEIIEG